MYELKKDAFSRSQRSATVTLFSQLDARNLKHRPLPVGPHHHHTQTVDVHIDPNVWVPVNKVIRVCKESFARSRDTKTKVETRIFVFYCLCFISMACAVPPHYCCHDKPRGNSVGNKTRCGMRWDLRAELKMMVTFFRKRQIGRRNHDLWFQSRDHFCRLTLSTECLTSFEFCLACLSTPSRDI